MNNSNFVCKQQSENAFTFSPQFSHCDCLALPQKEVKGRQRSTLPELKAAKELERQRDKQKIATRKILYFPLHTNE